MYEPLLFIHSWTRWILVVAALYFLIRSLWSLATKKPWKNFDTQFIWSLDQVFGYQLLFGITLWLAMSPYVKMAWANLDQLSQNPVVSFWFWHHPVTMLLAYGAFKFSHAKAKRSENAKKFKYYAAGLFTSLVLIFSAIPWPWTQWGRSLFRWWF